LTRSKKFTGQYSLETITNNNQSQM